MNREEVMEAMKKGKPVILLAKGKRYLGRLTMETRDGFRFEGMREGERFIAKVSISDLLPVREKGNNGREN